MVHPWKKIFTGFMCRFCVTAAALLFTMCLPAAYYKGTVVPSTFGSLCCVISTLGLFQGAILPLSMEVIRFCIRQLHFHVADIHMILQLAAEMSYPLPESTSGGFITLLVNVGALVLIGVRRLFR